MRKIVLVLESVEMDVVGGVEASAAEAGFAMLARDENDDSGVSADLDENPRYLLRRDFRSQFFEGERELSVYLPTAYFDQPEQHFPVFYMHDGQNLFDGRQSYAMNRTWRAHTTADAMAASGQAEPVILVGIANSGLGRMNEYTPTRNYRMGGGEGGRYGRMLVEEVKPLIDGAFRTRPGREHTAMGGSSLGGLITLALGLDYPQIFGKLAILSPSVWWDHRSLLALVNEAPTDAATRAKIWLDMGTAEGLRHLRDTDLLHRRLQQHGWSDGVNLAYTRIDGGVHDEDAWARRFDAVLRFLFPVS